MIRMWCCMFYGDYPLDFMFCVEECPIVEKCESEQGKVYPLECWRVVSEKWRREHEFDPDVLQLMDELNVEWAEKWR